QALLEDLRPHDRRADVQDHPAIEFVHGVREALEVDLRRAPDHRAVEHGMTRDDVVADPRMYRERDPVTMCRGKDGQVFPSMDHPMRPRLELMPSHGGDEIR